jgi:hypothetical protein
MMMKELSKKDNSYWNPEGFPHFMQNMTPDAKRILVIAAFMFIIYLLLLSPYLVASNSGESGIVTSIQKVDIASLPTNIQDLIPYKDKQYYAIVVVDDTHNVKDLKGQISKEKKLVLSSRPAEINEFVRADNIILNIYAPANLIPVTDQEFDTLIIGDTNRVEYGGIIEISNFLMITPILAVSRIVFFTGAVILILGFSLIYKKGIELWYIPALISIYSFQLFMASRIANANHLETDLIILLFGFMFLPGVYLTFKIMEFEESREGKKMISRIYRENINFYITTKSKIKETLKIH